MIVTLAGHVDHGKTSLVRALTGVDTDRLEIEKQRGLTIELGFAYGEFDSVRIGFVDVPGHHRFIRQMIAGVSSEQFALLVVAADEGPMPQTLEHLEVLEAIGLRRGLVVLTRIDCADATRRQQSREALARLLAGSFLEHAQVLSCSAHTGEGLAALGSALAAGARSMLEPASESVPDTSARAAEQHFRMCVDRAFTLPGAGLVVTGAVHSGQLQSGDMIVSGQIDRSARVRSMRVCDVEASCARTGDRVALNLTGYDLEDVKRGDWLLTSADKTPTSRVSLMFRAARNLPRPLHTWTRVHLHHGAWHGTGRLTLIDAQRLAAGEACLVDCLLDRPILAKWGDRLLLRDAASAYTLGGGAVIDTCIAERRGRSRGASRARLLAALSQADPIAALRCTLVHTRLVPLSAFLALRNVPESLVMERLSAAGILCLDTEPHRQLILASEYQNLQDNILKYVEKWHVGQPTSRGMSISILQREVAPHGVPDALLRHLVAHLVSSRKLAIRAGKLHLPSFQAHRTADENILLAALESAPAKAPTLGDLAKLTAFDAARMKRVAQRLEAAGELVFVNDRRVLTARTLDACIELAHELDTQPGFTVREFRDASGQGRNACIDILEYLDRLGMTRRLGDRRHVNQWRG